MRLIDADALKEEFEKLGYTYRVTNIIDNAPTAVDLPELKEAYQDGYKDGQNDRPQGECRTCKHRDPDNKKCDCGALERQGCPFPVNDTYFCKYYAKMGGTT